jgi:hypothetical protein
MSTFKGLATRSALHQIHGACSCRQAASLSAIGRERSINGVRRSMLGEFRVAGGTGRFAAPLPRNATGIRAKLPKLRAGCGYRE